MRKKTCLKREDTKKQYTTKYTYGSMLDVLYQFICFDYNSLKIHFLGTLVLITAPFKTSSNVDKHTHTRQYTLRLHMPPIYVMWATYSSYISSFYLPIFFFTQIPAQISKNHVSGKRIRLVRVIFVIQICSIRFMQKFLGTKWKFFSTFFKT